MLLLATAGRLALLAALASTGLDAEVTTEHYLLAEPTTATGEAREEALHAVVLLRRLETPRHTVYEREITFRDGGLRIHHTETVRGDSRRLVWREQVPHHARVWVCEWSATDRAASTISYGWKRPVHAALPLASPGATVGPLELLDAMRAGAATGDAPRVVVDPMAAAATVVRLSAQGDARRNDESLLLGGVPSDGSALEGVRFSEGAACLVPIDEREYGRRVERWRVSTPRPHERILRRIPTRR